MKRFYIPIFALMLFISGFAFISHSATYISTSQKEVIRDSKRLNDLTVLRTAIENYKTKNGFYPKLETGTNIKGYVNSVWPDQWTSFCNLIGLSSCPVDPVNEVIGCDCKIFNLGGNCTGDNINSNINTTTCYNSKSQSFACSDGSRLYQYQSLNNGRNYSLNMDFEYSDNVNWQVTSSSPDNSISVTGGCISGGNFYKVFSNKLPKCGDGILDYNEACEVGSRKTEFCKTSDNRTGIRYVNCSSSCLWDYNNVGNCITIGFCGDGIVQPDKGEECDGGYQKMCYSYQDNPNKNSSDPYANDSHHNWYNEQLRYCALNCKWSSNFIDSTAYCGGFCGDGIVQSDKGEECDNPSDPHCSTTTCKYQNSTPTINFDFFDNRYSKNSYIKSDVWSGDKFQYYNDYYGNGNTDLIIADKQGTDYVAVWHSDYIEIKVNAEDKENDKILYKYDFPTSYNYNFKLKYASSSDVSKTFYDYVNGSFVDGDIIRMYPTNVNNGKNTYKYFVTDDNNLLFGDNYVGYYTLRTTIKEEYNEGQNNALNVQGFTTSKDINFKIGPGCGDRILHKELGETCQFKPNTSISNIFVNWGVGQPSSSLTDNYCAATVYDSDSAKWSDFSCSNQYYGICEKRKEQGCDSSWIAGPNDNCYKLTSQKLSWDSAETECESNNSKLVVFDDKREADFLYNINSFKSQISLWTGYRKYSNKWVSIRGGVWNPFSTTFGWDIFRNNIYDGSDGLSNSDQYSCGLPWEYNACQDSRGYCGDGIVNKLFEECDETDKSSYGSGLDYTNQYECKKAPLVCTNTQNASYNKEPAYSCSYVNNLTNNPNQYNCRNSGGFCGDGFFQSAYEHCDSKTRITAADSAPATFGIDGFNHQYVCTPSNTYDYPYKDNNDFNLNKNSDSNVPCRKSSGGFCGDGTVQTFYSNDVYGNYIIDSSNIYSQSDPGWKNIAYDGLTGKHYFINGKTAKYLKGTPKDYFTQAQEDLLIEECDPKDYTPASILPKQSSEGQQYGGCGANDGTNNPCILEFYTTGTLKGVLKSHTGNCGCRKIQGGFCGNGNIESDFGEVCDPELADYAGAKLTNGSKVSILENSSSSKQYFCGATSKYSENIADLNQYDSSGSIVKTFTNTDQSDFSCQIFGGYCGDGVVQTDYTTRVLQNNQSYFYLNPTTLEQCDPKGHSVVARNSSSYNSYTCGSVNTDNACLNLDYSTKDLNNNYGGYCGDGKIQYDLTKPADNQAGANELASVSVDLTHPEQCDPRGHYVIPSNSTSNNQYDCGVTPNANACTDISGYCGNGVIDSYTNWVSTNPVNVSYNTCVVMDGKADSNNGKWYNVPCDWNTLRYVCEQENPTNADCINGFVKWSSGNNNCYSISNLAASNFDNASCPTNSHRVIINSDRENDFVNALVSSVNDWVWIGLSDENIKGQFVWSDNTGFAEECDPNSTDYKTGSASKLLVGGATDSNVNKQYLCGSTGVWTTSPSDTHKYDVNGNYVSSFAFDNKNQGNNSCMTFGGYCGDGTIQYDLYTTKHQSDQTFFYANSAGGLEQCDPNGHLVYLRNSSIGNQYGCGAAGTANACQNQGGYCGDGVKQSNEECDFASKTGNDYSGNNLIANGSGSITQNSSVSKQYKCGKPQIFDPIPGIKDKYNSSGDSILTFTNADFSSDNNMSACVTFGGFCGDGRVQTSYDVEHAQSDQSWFYANHGTLEECDPKNHSVVAQYSSNSNTYTCGSVNTSDACTNLDYTQKDSNNNYGGYCGDGKIQYDLTKPADSQGGSHEISAISVDLTHPEQCDPTGHSVTPAQSSVDNQYSCGAVGTANACLDIGGYCGDNILQTTYGETCDMGASLPGITDTTNQFCGTCVKFDCSTGSNISSSSVYLVRGNRLVSTYTGSLAIMNALSAATNNDVVFVGSGSFEFNNDYSIDLSGRNVTLNSCVSTVWNWK